MVDVWNGSEYTFQVSPNVGGHLFNIRARSADELATLVAEFAAKADAILDAFVTIRQITLAKGLLSVDSGAAAKGSAPAASSHAAPASAGAADLRCSHGPYKDFLGKTTKAGKPYQYRYYCAGPFGKQCEAKDLPGQQKQS